MRREARFCSGCGAYRNPPADQRQRRAEGRSTWRRISRVLVLYFVLLGTLLPLLLLDEDDAVAGMIVVSWVDALLILAAVPWLRVGLRERLVPSLRSLRWSGIGLVGLAPLLVVNVLYHHAIVEAFGLEETRIADGWNGWSFAAIVFYVGVMPGVWEEIAFRGLIQGSLERAVRPPTAIAMTAVLFATIHCRLASAPILLLLGLFLGWLRHRSRSLYPGMLVHFAHNLAVLLIE